MTDYDGVSPVGGVSTRRQLIRRGTAVAGAMCLPGLLAACGGSSSSETSGSAGGDDYLASLKKKGVARVAFAAAVPYSYSTGSGKPTGYENDEAQMILRRLGIPKITVDVVDFAALIPGLEAGRFDICTGALYVKPDRCRHILYANPDIADLEAFAVERGNPLGLKSFEDIAKNDKAHLGIIAGAAEIGYAQQAGVPDSRVQQYPDFPSALAAMASGRVNAVGFDNISIGSALKSGKYAGKFTMTPTFTFPAGAQPTFAAMTFNKDAVSLRDAYNRELAKLQQSGELVKLGKKYGISPDSITSCYDVKSDQICKG